MKNFEHYKDVFMRCKSRNLECVASKEILKRKCANNCAICVEFIKKWLYEEYKEPIKLNNIELEILKSFKKIYGGEFLFYNFDLLMLLYEYDYFNQVDEKLSLDEIIERSEVV